MSVIGIEKIDLFGLPGQTQDVVDLVEEAEPVLRDIRPDTVQYADTYQTALGNLSQLAVSATIGTYLIHKNNVPAGLGRAIYEQDLRHPQSHRVIRGRYIDYWAMGLSNAEHKAAAKLLMNTEDRYRQAYNGPVIASLTERQTPYACGIPQLMKPIGMPTQSIIPRKDQLLGDPYGLTAIGEPVQLYHLNRPPKI